MRTLTLHELIERRMVRKIRRNKRIFSTDVHDPNFNKPLSKLFWDYAAEAKEFAASVC